MNIIELTHNQKAYLFAKFSKQAYDEEPNFYGFESVKIAVDNHAAFVLYNATDIVVVCRGTEITDIKDITTDAKVILVESQTGTGKAHLGFETAAKAVWPHVLMLINNYHTTQRIWFTGHSLGAAMSLIMSAVYNTMLPDMKTVLFTYGCPRVGDRANTALGEVTHHRYVDSSDIVPRSPISWFRYQHFGQLHYLDKNGKEIDANWYDILKDRVLCFINNPTNIIEKHFINQYIKALVDAEVRTL